MGKSCCIRAKMVVFRQISCNRAKGLYSGKVVVFGQNWLLSRKSGCTRDKSGYIRAIWLYSVKNVCIREKVPSLRRGGCFRA